MRDYQESVTTGQTDGRTYRQTDAGQSDPYVPLCLTGDTINCENSALFLFFINQMYFTNNKMEIVLHQQWQPNLSISGCENKVKIVCKVKGFVYGR